MTRLQEKYEKEAIPGLKSRFGYKNVMEVPRLVKVVVNMGVGEATQDAKVIDAAVSDLTQISGQKPVVTRAKRSIAAFKVRAGVPVGCKVTLRGQRMYEFLDKLFNIALPRIRDFRGVSRSFDGQGRQSGTAGQLIFSEINMIRSIKSRDGCGDCYFGQNR